MKAGGRVVRWSPPTCDEAEEDEHFPPGVIWQTFPELDGVR